MIARTLNEPPMSIEPGIVAYAAETMKAARERPSYGRQQWEALVRQVDRRGADYRR